MQILGNVEGLKGDAKGVLLEFWCFKLFETLAWRYFCTNPTYLLHYTDSSISQVGRVALIFGYFVNVITDMCAMVPEADDKLIITGMNFLTKKITFVNQ